MNAGTWRNLSPALYMLLLAGALLLAKPLLPEWLLRPPPFMVWPFADWINAIFNFLSEDLGLIHVTRAIADGIQSLLDFTANILYGKNRWPRIGPLPWTVVAISATMIGASLGGWRLALLSGGTFVWIAMVGQWKWAMETLSVIIIAAPLAVLIGLLLGIAAWYWPRIERILNPILNIAQCMPHFAWMIPVVVFIGVGAKAGAIVTIIFAVPPMVRMTILGLKKVPGEMVENGYMCGATPWQILFNVRLPTARTDLLIGVNQAIMQCLAMVVLASFIGMPGLGQKLLNLLQSLKLGRSIEIGISIVLIGIMLDRCSRAWAMAEPQHFPRDTPWYVRYKIWLIGLALVLITLIVAQLDPYLHTITRRMAFSFSKPLDNLLEVILVTISPITEWLRWFVIVHILIPLRDAWLWLPFTSVLLALAAAGYSVGKWRSMWVCLAFAIPISMTGYWDRAIITVYMVTFSVFIAFVVGFPLGIWSARHEARAKRALLVCDTLQIFPSFIYLIPVIMLFGVSDISVIGAVILFATVPVLRYTIEGLRGVPASITEAANMSGASMHQVLWHVQMPVALPTIMTGVNQSILFALFMVIIAAFIGTQDLGQEMQRALSFTDVGKGLVLGLAVAFMALIADHLAVTWASTRKRALGLE